jgi:hypothetical protein
VALPDILIKLFIEDVFIGVNIRYSQIFSAEVSVS